jgi:hypothetical protein
MQLTDTNGNTWTATAVGFDGRGRAVFELRDERGIPRTARLSLVTLCRGRATRRWLRHHTGIDVVFDATRQHCGDLGRLARELNA